MGGYVLPHDLAGERQRLALMSELMDPWHRHLIERLGLRPDWQCLEVGCGNGSISLWLASQLNGGGKVIASDIDTTYVEGAHVSNLEVRPINVVEDRLDEGVYDLVTARALLHHLPAGREAVERMIGALKPRVLLCIEPDFLPATAAEPESMRAFWKGWLDWSVTVGIDYFIGQKMPRVMVELGLDAVAGEGHTAMYRGGSPWATYWLDTLKELGPKN
jgi:SAM-dependent methyltransferase